MKHLSKLTIPPLVALLAACGNYDLDAVSKMPNSGGAFDRALQKEYLALAVAEDDESDYDDAEFFANKAIAAASGQTVGPQDISERTLNAKYKARAGIERRKLAILLTEANKSAHPAAAAKAQAMFDCYLQEAEENNQPDHIDACLRGMEKAMLELGMTPTRSRAFVVYFDFDSGELNAKALKVVNSAAAMARNGGSVVLFGHTDTMGDPVYNKGLSKARVIAVKNALLEAGVNRKAVTMNYYGETKPRIPTADETKAALNRRVEITVK